MDFEDDEFSGGGGGSIHRNEESFLSSQPAKVSIRGIRSGNRRRKRPGQENSDDFSEGSSFSNATHTSSMSSSLVVRGARASAWAVQDAGSFQMLQDECNYLCSTLMAARSSNQALEAAIDLALFLAPRKTRNILWQSIATDSSTNTTRKRKPAMESPESETFTTNSVSPSDSHVQERKNPRTILDSILDVLALAGSEPIRRSCRGGNSSNDSIGSQSSRTGSPIRKGPRTKSARRKLKQHQTTDDLAGSALGWSVAGISSPELRQAFILIAYFLSLDCTLSSELSVAAMGKTLRPALARNLRLAILSHGKALKSIVKLCMDDPVSRSSQDNPSSKALKPLSVSWDDESKAPRARVTSENNASSGTLSRKSSRTRTGRRKLAAMATQDIHDTPIQTQESSSMDSDSLSSVSLASSVPEFSQIHRTGDPTKLGRRNRRRRRLHQQCEGEQQSFENSHLPMVKEEVTNGDELDWPEMKIVPPPPPRQSRGSNETNLSFSSEGTSGSSSFALPASPPRKKRHLGSDPGNSDHSMVSTTATSVGSAISAIHPRLVKTLQQLQSKVQISSEKVSVALAETSEITGDTSESWISLLCLESVNRIITGKERDGTSCLESNDDSGGEDYEDEGGEIEEQSNPILYTNTLLGRSGAIPHLALCMSRALKTALFHLCREQNTIEDSYTLPSSTQWVIWHERITILASLIDGACLFNKGNRISLAEHDPLSFDYQNQKEGLVFYILMFIRQISASISTSVHRTLLSSLRLLALRTLTSLTHDNELAAEHMTQCYSIDGYCSETDNGLIPSNVEGSAMEMRGIDVLARLVFDLEASRTTQPPRGNRTDSKCNRRSSNLRNDEELHRFDSTIFCLNTLANIIEASDVRRMLAEIIVPSETTEVDGSCTELWLKWLCQWLVKQTDGFREAILSIGKDDAGTHHSERELKKNEEDKLVAAGNGCVLLACLMVEPEEISEEPESTNTIRKLILDEMPVDDNSKSTGVMMIINTLKAFCNFYHFSLGDLSVAVVAPIKKLIDGLDDLQKAEGK